MDSNRIEEIQKGTAYPNSVSVMSALKQVWNECEHEKKHNKKAMIYTLRTQDNLPLATVEVGLETLTRKPYVEIRSIVHIQNYTQFLLEHLDTEEVIDIMKTFDTISNLREWMWNDYFAMKGNNELDLEPIVKHVKDILLAATHEFNLKLE